MNLTRRTLVETRMSPLSPPDESNVMRLHYSPLLHVQREIQGLPRNYERFQKYLRTILNSDGTDVELVPMLAMNPMGKDHVTLLLDELLGMNADGVGATIAAELADELSDSQGEFRAALIVVDDLLGGWTNRWSYEYSARFPSPGHKRFWVTGYLWASEPTSIESVRAAMSTAIHRTAYVEKHGCARSLRELLHQEGEVMRRSGCTSPNLDADDLDYTRQVIEPFLDADDMRTSIECLFGDSAAETLGFTPRGLSQWAGIAVALHDAISHEKGLAFGVSSSPKPQDSC